MSQTHEPADAAATEGRPTRMARSVRSLISGERVGTVAGQVERLEQRVAELEEEVREVRRHHLRTAELTDLVQALLIPLATRDEAELAAVLERYTEQLG